MSKEIFALCGAPDTGKTTTIKLAYERISNQRVTDSGDIVERIEINGVPVVFISGGDEPIPFEEYEDCSIIVCPTRNKGRTVATAEKFSHSKGYKLYWFQACAVSKSNKVSGDGYVEYIESVNSYQNKANRKIAELLVDLVKDRCATYS